MKDARHFMTELEAAFGASAMSLRESPWCGGLDAVHLMPESLDCVPEALKWASAHDVTVIPSGSCLEPRVSNLGEDHPLILDLTRCRRVVEYGVEDLVFTAECGLTLKAAGHIVEQEGHSLPLHPPFPSRATLGGVVARGAEGLTAATYGRVRDHVLGLRVAHSDGRITRCGGRVVKNVTGYDLVRLLVGSRGSLGVILEVTLRLLPKEPYRGGVVVSFSTIELAMEAARHIRDAHPSLLAIQVLPSALLRQPTEEAFALLLSLRGEPEYGAALQNELIQGLPRSAAACEDPIPMQAAWEETFRGGLTVATLPSRCGALLREIVAAVEPNRSFVLDVLSGCLRLAPQDMATFESEERKLAPILERHQAYGERREDAMFHNRRAHVFPHQKWDGLPLMDSIAKTLDPAGVMMRGRRDF